MSILTNHYTSYSLIALCNRYIGNNWLFADWRTDVRVSYTELNILITLRYVFLLLLQVRYHAEHDKLYDILKISGM